MSNVAIEPDQKGHFGAFGGMYVPETLMHPLRELEAAYNEALQDSAYTQELQQLQRDYTGRPTPLYFAAVSYTHLTLPTIA